MSKHRGVAGKLTPENSFLIDRETYAAMMGLVEMAENEKKRVQEQLNISQAQLRDLQADRGGQLTEVGKLERSNRQLCSENEELRSLCCFLDDQRQRSNQLAGEWQSFGKYTAEVLGNEVETFECKLQALREAVERLGRENTELREMCLYLDQSRGEEDGSGNVKLSTPPTSQDLSVHSLFAPELNSKVGEVPRYTGLTSHSTLKDTGRRQRLGTEHKPVVAELEKRVERLEMEKLELVKSLSAAHLLAANLASPTHQPLMEDSSTHHLLVGARQRPITPIAEEGLERPPKLNSLLRHSTPLEGVQSDGVETEQKQFAESPTEPQAKTTVCPEPEVVMQAIILLDVCKRLAAMEVSGFSDAMEEAEVATLRVLIDIAWKKLQKKVQSTSSGRSKSQRTML